MSFQIIDLGWKRIKNSINQLHNKKVEVGFLDNKENIAYIASIQEFGTRNKRIPERPFMRNAIKENLIDYQDLMKQRVQMLIRNTIAPKGILRDAGIYWEFQFMKSIKNFSTPRNADSTIARKGFNDPLIHYGLMLAMVKYKIK